MTYKYKIEILNTTKNQGFVEGAIDDFSWFAIVQEEPVEFGIDPHTLSKGAGKVTRLCLYKDNYDVEGNPYLPSLSIKRMIYANYQHEWSILNHKYRDMVYELVTYLERRYSMHVLR
jgi:hypothetical protein